MNPLSPSDSPPERAKPAAKKSRRRQRGRTAVDQYLVKTEKDLDVDALLNDIVGANDESPAKIPGGQLPLCAHARLPPYVRVIPMNRLLCELCTAPVTSRTNLWQHILGKKHKTRVLIYAHSKKRGFLAKDKDEVTITSDFDTENGNLVFKTNPNKAVCVVLTIHNNSETDLCFHRCEMLKRMREYRLDDEFKVTEGKQTLKIAPGQSYDVRVTVTARHYGTYSVPLAFVFTRDVDQSDYIHIVRYPCARCRNDVIDDMQPTQPFQHPPRVHRVPPDVKVVDGIPLPKHGASSLERKIDLPMYSVTDSVRRVINKGMMVTAKTDDKERREMLNIRALLDSELNAGNHQRRFDLLLTVEEIQMEVDIRRYDMRNATLGTCQVNKTLLTLEVPGLAENRPSVLKGDHLFVRRIHEGKPEATEYKGYVHSVQLNQVSLGFSRKLRDLHLPNMKYNVRFSFNRNPIRLQHRAVQLAEEHSLHPLLYPTPAGVCVTGTIQPMDAPLTFYDRQLETNEEQARAVRHIVAGTSRPAPYVIFGPPGTGKTVTMVEAIKQVMKCLPKSHVLACTPSNSAADLLTQRLLKHMPKSKEIIRMMAASRDWFTVPEDIKFCCNYNKDSRDYFYPSIADLMQYRVIVCTLVTAGRLASANFPAGHFSHVFVDEAGHSVEPEALVALAGIMELDVAGRDGGQVVLAGDPQQLGPVLRSPIAIEHGLGMSLLERYMSIDDVYGRRTGEPAYDHRLITKLVRNYRSHPDILKLPNKCFYDNELIACADVAFRESLCRWKELPMEGVPLIFHGVVGEDLREERSPSYFNAEEAATVVDYIGKLLESKGMGVSQKDVAVISPYRKQVQKLRTVFKKNHWKDIKVGSVEEFQGQESKIVIISTVRSNPDFLGMDIEFHLGFLRNPKRFNVAVTRAKALLIVVGNPFTLSRDEHWNLLLEECCDRGAYRGCEYDPSVDNQMEDVMQRFSAVKLAEIGKTINEVEVLTSAVQDYVEPEWRSEN